MRKSLPAIGAALIAVAAILVRLGMIVSREQKSQSTMARLDAE
jgi:hypothetical protein